MLQALRLRRIDARFASWRTGRLLLEVLHGPVEVPARLLEGARADQLVLTRCAVNLLARPLHRPLVARDPAGPKEEAQRHDW